MILTLNKRLHAEVLGETLTHAYYYPFNKVMVYLEFSGDFKDVVSTLLKSKEISSLTNTQREITQLDLITCQQHWEAGERFLEYDDIFPVKSIKHEN